ncbi:TonB-dependent receptor [Dyadobacter sp. CY107]|uniref:TonB-dependent receptor n=1 Tax=Dyadobacter fanqingshengii TaxID=2906443 RepID=UPI001F359DE2|nr:TonB-dependent receptor [Dyadobacter fanqingshengii]MCF2502007.1 TonB-dependent receptor [Dyadobacter fanqingshengii]
MQKSRQTVMTRARLARISIGQILLIVLLVGTAFSAIPDKQNILDQRISLRVTAMSLDQVLEKIEQQVEVKFVYSHQVISADRKVTLQDENSRLESVLKNILDPLGVSYKLSGRSTILLKRSTVKNSLLKPLEKPEKTQSVSLPDSNFMVKGQVFDSKEPPVSLPGVTIQVKNTDRGVTSDANGNFEIPVKNGEVLVFTFIGLDPKEIVVSGTKNLVISLAEQNTALNEVVVTGYSEQKARNLANAIGKLDVKAAVANKPITQLSQALQGGVTGLTVMQGSGMAGEDRSNILIRGISTIGGTSPLVLVDGVPFDINSVDPTTVESITVLKDAAAASIYGARAANGVILVTTKRGIPGKLAVTYDGYGGVQKANYLPKFVDAPKYMSMVNEAYANIGGLEPYSQESIQKTREGTNPVDYPNTNWSELILNKNPVIQSHSVSLSGGNELARFAVSGNYLYQDGLTPKRDFQRFSFRANTGVTLTKNISMLLDLVATRSRRRSELVRFGNSLHLVYSTPPNIVPKYPMKDNGYQAYGNFGEMMNPMAELERGGYSQSTRDEININFQPVWQITPELKLRGQYLYRVNSTGGIDNRDSYNFLDYYTGNLVFTYANSKGSSIGRSTYNYLSSNLEFSQTYGKHFIYAIGGLSREANYISNYDQANLASYFVKFNYVFNNKYLLESTVRADGSSKFGPGHKWGTFPSVAVGWNVHNEEFLKDVKFVSSFKLRASYGLMGNNGSNEYVSELYRYQSLIDGGNGTETSIGNPEITWETVKMLDIGADIRLFQNLGLTIDWFSKRTDNILLTPPLSLSSGVATLPINSGSVSNKGWEFMLNYSKAFNRDLEMSASVGYSYYSNKILSLRGGPYIGGNGLDINQVGYPVNSYFLYKTDGLLTQGDIDGGTTLLPGQKVGDIKYIDINGDKNIDKADKLNSGNPNPQGSYFANLNFVYKRFSIETQLNGFTKSLAYYSGRYQTPLNVTSNFNGGTPMQFQTDYWTPENPNAMYPRLAPDPGNNVLPADYWLTNAAFLRVKYIQLGYNFNPVMVKKMKLSALRIFVNTQNAITLSKMKHFDPETRGDESNYPIMKVFTVGLNVKF